MQESSAERRHGHRGEGHLLPDLRAALRDGRDGRGRPADQGPARPRPPALARASRARRGSRWRRSRTTPTGSCIRCAAAATAASSASPGPRPWTRSARGSGRSSSAHGGDSVGWYMGNPGAFSYSHPLWVKGFLDALGSPHSYTASSQDVSNRFAASALLYGSPFIVPIPDLARTDFLLMRRRQPARLARQRAQRAAGQGPAARDHRARRARRRRRPAPLGDRARRSSTSPIDPDADAWLLLSMLQVIFDEGLEDAAAIERQSRGVDALRAAVRGARPRRRPRARTGVPADAGPRRSPATSPGPSARPSTGAPAPASGATGRWSRSCSTRSTWSPATSTARAARCSAIPPIDFSRIADLIGARHLRRSSAPGSATFPRCSARCPPR